MPGSRPIPIIPTAAAVFHSTEGLTGSRVVETMTHLSGFRGAADYHSRAEDPAAEALLAEMKNPRNIAGIS